MAAERTGKKQQSKKMKPLFNKFLNFIFTSKDKTERQFTDLQMIYFALLFFGLPLLYCILVYFVLS
jgi:hypothetical protein